VTALSGLCVAAARLLCVEAPKAASDATSVRHVCESFAILAGRRCALQGLRLWASAYLVAPSLG
jgi:hypothetical protein